MSGNNRFAPPGAPASKRSEQINDGIIKKVFKLDPNLIKPNPYQPRKYFNDDEIKQFGLEIKKHGQIQAILVLDTGSDYFLIAGERRLRACKSAEIEVDCIVRKGDESELKSDRASLHRTALMENLGRSDLTPIEVAESLNELHKLPEYSHMSLKEFAQDVKMPYSTLRRYLSVLDLPVLIKDSLREGADVSLVALERLSKLESANAEKAFEMIVSNNLGKEDAIDLIESGKKGKGSNAAVSSSKPSAMSWGSVKQTNSKATITIDFKKVSPNVLEKVYALLDGYKSSDEGES